MNHKLDPAATIIDICGGIYSTAAIVGCHRTTVYRWMQPDGTGGKVPQRHIITLLEANPFLKPAHFFVNIGKPQNGRTT